MNETSQPLQAEPIATPTPAEGAAASRSGLAIAAIVIAILALAGVFTMWALTQQRLVAIKNGNSDLNSKLEDVVQKSTANATEIASLKLMQSLNTAKGLVDLAEPSLQDLGQSGFYVGKLAVEEHLTGIKISGRMINTQSVDHTNITFELTVGGQTKQFTINRVSSGNSTAFTVYLPDVSKENARYGRFAYQNSTVSYYTK